MGADICEEESEEKEVGGGEVVLSVSMRNLFPDISQELTDALENSYAEILKNFREHRFEPTELNGGKFAEAVYRILEHHTHPDHEFTPVGQVIPNFNRALRKFHDLSAFPRSIRFHVPFALDFLYVVRNHRGVGHLGGDVNPNHMDAMCVLYMSKWILAELIRVMHKLSVDEAAQLVERIVSTELHIVWKVGDSKRILDSGLDNLQKSLVLLLSEHPKPIHYTILSSWIEYSNASMFKTRVIQKMHKSRHVELDAKSGLVFLSPIGVRVAESIVLDASR